MRNSMQLKALLRNMSAESHISAQLLLQNYMLERLLERISLSKFKDNCIIKGGFLIASMVGLDTRSTMDMDTTVKGYPVSKETMQDMIKEIIGIDAGDGVRFELINIANIREDDEYNGYRASIAAYYESMKVILKIDITTGDTITPSEIAYSYRFMFEDRAIDIMAYNLETILAEKLETIISRADQNTRLRDYYDVYILGRLKNEEINIDRLKEALIATSEKRGSLELMQDYRKTLKTVSSSTEMNKQWDNYQKNYEYAVGIAFADTCRVVAEILGKITGKNM